MKYTLHVPLNGWGIVEIDAKDVEELQEKRISITVDNCVEMDLDIFPGGYVEDENGDDVDIDV